jgi:hypothetical protein
MRKKPEPKRGRAFGKASGPEFLTHILKSKSYVRTQTWGVIPSLSKPKAFT